MENGNEDRSERPARAARPDRITPVPSLSDASVGASDAPFPIRTVDGQSDGRNPCRGHGCDSRMVPFRSPGVPFANHAASGRCAIGRLSLADCGFRSSWRLRPGKGGGRGKAAAYAPDFRGIGRIGGNLPIRPAECRLISDYCRNISAPYENHTRGHRMVCALNCARGPVPARRNATPGVAPPSPHALGWPRMLPSPPVPFRGRRANTWKERQMKASITPPPPPI